MQAFLCVVISDSLHRVFTSSEVMDSGQRKKLRQRNLLQMLKLLIKPDVLQ